MKHSIIAIAAAAALAACSGSDTPAQDNSASTPPGTTGAATPASSLPAGTHCYFRDSEDVTEGLEVTVTEAGDLSASNYGTIHQDDEGYYTSFDIQLTSGMMGEDGLITFDAVTQVDGDTQTGPMTWSITPEAAAPDGYLDAPMEAADCEGLEIRVFPPPGEE